MSLIGISGKTYDMGSFEIMIDGIEGVKSPPEIQHRIVVEATVSRSGAKTFNRLCVQMTFPHRRYRVSKRRAARADRRVRTWARWETGLHDWATHHARLLTREPR